MKKIITTAIACVSISSTYAEITTTSIFCATSDGSHWDWLMTNEGGRVPIPGDRGRNTNPGGSYFDYFAISEAEYNFLKRACQLMFASEYVPHPSDDSWKEWHIFLVNRLDGSHYFSDGYKTTTKNESSYNWDRM